ncbi:MAG: glycosyltransferase family 2 protein [Burkholderiales bacterium]
MTFAPVALFAYDRPSHLRQAVEALLDNPEARESRLVVFSDGPRNERSRKAVTEVRLYARQITGFASVDIIEREENWGLARSIIDGVSSMCARYGRVIVLEDDIVTSRHFLRFMNDALDLYQNDERVISIHGYQYPVNSALPETFFLKGADCWGWATWKRGWDLFEPDGRILLQELRARELAQRFDFDGAYPYTRMLENQISGKNDSWAIRWHASAFLKGKLTLYPGRSLVRNIGLDGSGTHCSTAGEFAADLAASPVAVSAIPVEENALARQKIAGFLKTSRPTLAARVLRKLTSLAQRAI